MQEVGSSSQCMSGPIPFTEMPGFHSKRGKMYPPWPRILVSQVHRNHSTFYTKITKTGSNRKSKTKLWNMACPFLENNPFVSWAAIPISHRAQQKEASETTCCPKKNRERCWSVSLPEDASSRPPSLHNCYSIKSLHVGETCKYQSKPAPPSLGTFHSES